MRCALDGDGDVDAVTCSTLIVAAKDGKDGGGDGPMLP